MSRDSSNTIYNPEDIIKKETRGLGDDADFGEVQDVQGTYVIIQRGIIDKGKYYIPKEQAESYDGNILNFRISEHDLKTKYKDESFMSNAESNTLENEMNV